MKKLILILMFISAANLWGNGITQYEYWFGNDYAGKTTVLVNTGEIFDLDTEINLPPGTGEINQMLNIRFLDENGRWSAVKRIIVHSDLTNSNNKIVAYKHWFEGENPQTTSVNDTELLDLELELELPAGKEAAFYYIRFQDGEGKWSPVYRYLLRKPVPFNDNKIVSYEYWFNNDKGNKLSMNMPQAQNMFDIDEEIDIPQQYLGDTVKIAIRYMDSNGDWSEIVSADLIFEGTIPPNMLLPDVAQSGVHPLAEFRWTSLAGATEYILQIHDSDDFGFPDIEITVQDTNHMLSGNPLEYSTVYFWRVKAVFPDGESNWSEPWPFRTCDEGSQTIAIQQGWNYISSRILPIAPDMADVFAGIADDIVIVKDNSGKSYLPGFGINQIGNWDFMQGYQLYSEKDTSLALTGCEAPPGTALELDAGWNIISYLPVNELSAVTAMESLTDDGNMVIMKNSSGAVYLPDFGLNNIGNMIPGQAYQIFLQNSDVLVYP
jgi:hypothetical protein